MFRRIAVTLVVFLTLPAVSTGQWSPDSTENLCVCDVSGEQLLPRMAGTSDGGSFISWFDSRSGGYSLYIQRYDSTGTPLLPDSGLLISDEPQQSWLTDYDLAVDSDDNAVVVFSDERNGTGELDVSAYRIGSAGEFLWGTGGICLSDTSLAAFEPAPTVAVTPAGNSIFAWGRDGSIVFQKISAAGVKLWGDNGIVLERPPASLSCPDIVPAGEDSAIVLWKRSTGTFPAEVTHLYVQMLDVNGDWAWSDTDILIYDGGAISAWNVPVLSSDEAGGGIVSWYDAPDLSTFNVWVQHMDFQGSMLFPVNGAQASTNSSDRLHMYPAAVHDPVSQQTWVYWVEENDNQTMFGLYGQLFDASGQRQWTDSGMEFLPLGSHQISGLNALLRGNRIVLGYLIDTGGTALRALGTDLSGNTLWGPVTLSASSLGAKSDPVCCPGPWGGAVFTWTDNRTDYGVYAQNVTADGELGSPTGGIPGRTRPVGPYGLTAAPNPATGSLNIDIRIPTGGYTAIEIYDLAGRMVETLFSGDLDQGDHSLVWNCGDEFEKGVYFARVRTSGGSACARIVLL